MSVRVTTLDNGMRVVTGHMPHLETVSLGVWVGAGARWEDENENGISHLLEHMAFKGTPSRTAMQIAEEIESVGGDLNAATSLEATCFYVRILKNDVPLALDLLSDILQNPLFEEAELIREKDVILQEIAGVQDSPDDIVYELAQAAAYPGQPVGRPILGTEQSVMSMSADQLRTYMGRHYTADRMVISAAGAVDHDEIVALSSRLFSGIKSADSNNAALPTSPPPTSPAAIYRGGTRRSDKSFEQSHIILAFKGLSYLDDEYYTSQVFSGLFGGGMSSRLFQEVREKRGLCYSIYSFSWGLSDTGLFGIHAEAAAENMAQTVNVITDELQRAAAQNPSEAELARAKAQLKAGLLMSLESSSARAEQLARQILAFGKPLEVSDLIARVDAVNAEDVRQLAKRLFTDTVPACATVGATASLEAFSGLEARIA